MRLVRLVLTESILLGLAGGALVVTQVALALILLVGSALMVRSFRELRAVDPRLR